MEGKRQSRVLSRTGRRKVRLGRRRGAGGDTDDSDSSSRRAGGVGRRRSAGGPKTVRVKFHHDGEIRVVNVAAGTSFDALKGRLEADYRFPVVLRYEDAEGDLVTLACQNDLMEMLASGTTGSVTVRVEQAAHPAGSGGAGGGPMPAPSMPYPAAAAGTLGGTGRGGFGGEAGGGGVGRRGPSHPLASAASALLVPASHGLGGGGSDAFTPHHTPQAAGTPSDLGAHPGHAFPLGTSTASTTTAALAALAVHAAGQGLGSTGGSTPRAGGGGGGVGFPSTASTIAPYQPGGSDFRWQRGEKLGAGAFGTVYQGLNMLTGELMAVKQLDAADVSARELAGLEHEITMARGLHHPNIVTYLGTTRDAHTMCIFLEYAPGGSIRQLLERFGKLDEPIVRTYTRQLLLGLEYLHRNGIAHRDIKGANVLVGADGTVKLADFGASKRIGANSTVLGTQSGMGGGLKGTPLWMAPEVIKNEQSARGWKKADIWSVGCTVIEMLTGRPPWPDFPHPFAAMMHISTTEAAPETPEGLSRPGRDFLARCFARDPTERPDVTALLLHEWISQISHLLPAGRVADDTGLPLRPSTADLDGTTMRTGSRLREVMSPIVGAASPPTVDTGGGPGGATVRRFDLSHITEASALNRTSDTVPSMVRSEVQGSGSDGGGEEVAFDSDSVYGDELFESSDGGAGPEEGGGHHSTITLFKSADLTITLPHGGAFSPHGVALRPTPAPLNPVQTALRDAETVLRRVFLVSGARDGSLKCWNRLGDAVRSLKGQRGAVSVLAAAPVHLLLRSLARALEAVGIGVHGGPVAEPSHARALQARVEAVHAVALEVGCLCSCLASGGSDHVVRLWDVDGGRVLRNLSGHRGAITALRWLTPAVLASASVDGTVRLWDVASATCIQVLLPASGAALPRRAVVPEAEGSASCVADALASAGAPSPSSAVTRMDWNGKVLLACTRGGACCAYHWNPRPAGADTTPSHTPIPLPRTGGNAAGPPAGT